MAKSSKKKTKYVPKKDREKIVENTANDTNKDQEIEESENVKGDAVPPIAEPEVPAIEAEPITEEKIKNALSAEELDELIAIAIEQFKNEKKKSDEIINKINAEIESAKEQLKKYQDDIAQLDEQEQEFQKLKSNCDDKQLELSIILEDLKDKGKKVEKEKEKLETIKLDAKNIKREANETAKEEARGIKAAAEEEARGIKAAAEQAAQEIKTAAVQEASQKVIDSVKEAGNNAQKTWNDAVNDFNKKQDELRKQAIDISNKEIENNRKESELKKKETELNEDISLLEEEKEFVKALKEKYSSYSPTKIEKINLELEDEKGRYKALKEKYDEKIKEFNDLQVLLDSFKYELNQGDENKSVSDIVRKLQEVTKELEETKRILENYPTIESIDEIAKKAKEFDTIKENRDEAISELEQWKEKYNKVKRTENELKVVKKEIEATNALNEHLLKELESHKTALESRTGDTCPSLTKVDAECETESFETKINKIKNTEQLSKLSDIVYHVKNFAGSRKNGEELWYKDDDIRAFLAGMAVSKLIILQGMSGTGKSSLPKIFSQAILGFNNLIPVESSWRDRNELLGYYNDFNKKFNAKTFTIELYRSSKKCLQNIPSFMVLDEMNLARIEYYFSDFLSILQESKDKWLIELVSSDMRTLPMQLDDETLEKMKKEEPSIYSIWEKIDLSRKGNLDTETTEQEKTKITEYLKKLNCLVGAKELIDGRKIKVTDNVWFIGTANNDESTFEITDKVYDRAQVITLNEPGKNVKERKYEERKPMYLPVDKLLSLFDDAKINFTQSTTIEEEFEKVRKVMINYFNTSFGDRILRQATDYAAVFIESGGSIINAIDYQLSTKVIRKILSSDRIEGFKELQKITKGKYNRTTELIEKRIKELEDESNY